MGKIMSHGALEFPGGSLDKIDPGGPMSMEVDKARHERKPIEAQSPAPASPRLLYGLGADGDDPAAADEHSHPAKILPTTEHAGSAKQKGYFFG